jgi:ABC-type transporter MlaC component
MQKLLVAAIFVVAAFLSGPAGATNAQQQKMKDCNAQASSKQLKGDARKSFMSECLKADSAQSNAKGSALPELSAQQQKMKTCNSEAKQKHLQGKDRKTFMSTCLSGSH